MNAIREIIKNYKTTASALLILLSIAIYWADLITKEQLETGIAILASFGLLAAKDYENGRK